MTKKTQLAVMVYLSFVQLGAAFGAGVGTGGFTATQQATPGGAYLYTAEQIAVMRAKSVMDLNPQELEVLQRSERWMGTHEAMRNRFTKVRTEIARIKTQSMISSMRRFFDSSLKNAEVQIGAEAIAKLEGLTAGTKEFAARVDSLLSQREGILRQNRFSSWLRQLDLKAKIMESASVLYDLELAEQNMRADMARGGHPNTTDLSRSTEMQGLRETLKEQLNTYNTREAFLKQGAKTKVASSLTLEEVMRRVRESIPEDSPRAPAPRPSAGGGYRNQNGAVPSVGIAVGAQ